MTITRIQTTSQHIEIPRSWPTCTSVLDLQAHCWSTLPLPLSAGQSSTRELTPSKRIQHNHIQTYHDRYKTIQIDTGTPRDDWHQNAKRRHDSGRTVQYSISITTTTTQP